MADGSGTIQAARAIESARALSRAVRQVADVFQAADRGQGSSVVRVRDGGFANVLVDWFPGLSTGPIQAAIEFDRGRRIGRILREVDPDRARRLLHRLHPGAIDAHLASGVLSGLGAAGFAGLVARAGAARRRSELTPAEHRSLLGSLAGVLTGAGATIGPPEHPTDPPIVLPDGIDLRLLRRLGAFRHGRLALRAVVRHLHVVPAGLTVELAAALLLGPSGHDDQAAGAPLPGLGEGPSSLDLAELPMLRLLAADPFAAAALEARHPRGPSPALTILRGNTTRAELPVVATILGHVANGAVDAGWAPRWREGIAPPGLGHRLLDGLADGVIEADGRTRAPVELSRMLARALELHPGMAERLARDLHPSQGSWGGERVATLTRSARFYEIVARDLPSLDRALGALVAQRSALVRAELRRHGPGDLAPLEAQAPFDHVDPQIRDLALGADAAGKGDRIAVMLATKLVAVALPAISSTAAKVATGPAAGALVGAAAAGATRVGARRAKGVIDDRWGHTDDHREDEITDALAGDEAWLVARSMASDARWSKVLRSPVPPAVTHAEREQFRAWVAAQPAEISSVLEPLLTSRYRRTGRARAGG
ncbi:MAG: hypothetical protein JWM89_3350 [Acidimicrobiales bacterium]|nr:hypothetical protein [Acidimicrobiales bacterium]